MKKHLSIIVCSVLAATCLCACGSKTSPSNKTVANDAIDNAVPVANYDVDGKSDASEDGSLGAIEYDQLSCLGNYDVLYLFGTGYCFPHGTFDVEGFRDWLIENDYELCRFRQLIDAGKWYEDSSGARFLSLGDEPPYMYGAKLGDFTGCTYRDLIDRHGNPIDFNVQDETYYECDFGKFRAAF